MDIKKPNKMPTKKALILGGAGLSTLIGVILFIAYFVTMNMALGAPGVILTLAGGITFYIYRQSDEEWFIEGSRKSKEQFTSLKISSNEVIFDDSNPEGFKMKCRNDGKKYYVNIEFDDNVKPFILPDQQYMAPDVFGQRVLQLPAHKKLFTKRQDLLQKLKPLFIILAIIVVWILIITTTGNNEGETASWLQIRNIL